MCAVLRLCYPVDTAPSEIIVDMPVLDALQKYMMEDAKKRWKSTIVFLDLAKTQPLRIFAIACRCRWGDIARAAARAILSIPLRDWQSSAELRNITGMDYHVLLKYYTQCSDAVEQAFSPPIGSHLKLAVPLGSSHDMTRLTNLMKDFFGKGNLACRYSDGSDSPWASVPSWVERLVENARDRSRNCPGRAVTCNESLVVAALDAGETARRAQFSAEDSADLQSSAVLDVCRVIDAGVQDVINKVYVAVS